MRKVLSTREGQRSREHILPDRSISASLTGARRTSQHRDSGERSERSLDAAEHFHRIRNSKRRHVSVTGLRKWPPSVRPRES